jgi:hypothetical protein
MEKTPKIDELNSKLPESYWCIVIAKIFALLSIKFCNDMTQGVIPNEREESCWFSGFLKAKISPCGIRNDR